MNLQTAVPYTSGSAFMPARVPSSVNDFSIRHLKTHAEIERILSLRNEIDLSVHTAHEADFFTREKKETSAVLSAHSSLTVRQ